MTAQRIRETLVPLVERRRQDAADELSVIGVAACVLT